METLTKLLLEWQKERQLTDNQLAHLLLKESGEFVSASMISYLRSGQRKLGIDTVRAIWGKIPELRNECNNWFLYPAMDLRTQKEIEDLKAMR